MKEAALPKDEDARLAALRELDILDSLPEQAFDDITYLAAQMCAAPIALVSLVDETRQWFKSTFGIDVQETPRELSFCAHAILQPETLLVVENAAADPRFADNPLVTGEPGVGFYAGAPLITSDGHALGTLCVVDHAKRGLTEAQGRTLQALARQVVAQLELRRAVTALEAGREALEDRNRQLSTSRDELARMVDMLERQAEVIERDLHRAEIIQRSLLPRTAPRLERYCIHTLYRPGRTIGGDLYDVVAVSDRYLVLVVADAAGHGVSAAMLSVLFKLRLELLDEHDGRPLPPSEVLERANRALLIDRPAPGVFVTATCGVLDLAEQRLALASAGHPPVLWLHAAGGSTEIAATGPALGLDLDARYETHQLDLTEDDQVLLYTDGLMDICDSPPTQAAIASAVGRMRGDEQVLEHLLIELTGRRVRPDCDDVTLLLLRASPGANVFNEVAHGLDLEVLPETPDPVISAAETPEATVLVLEGRIVWLHAQLLFDTAMAVLESGRSLILDLQRCLHLDSTVLGTLHELVLQAKALGVSVRLQHVGGPILETLRELSLRRVIAAVADVPIEVPEARTPVDLTAANLNRQQQRLLKAHEMLASLSDGNREEFGPLVGALRAELGRD